MDIEQLSKSQIVLLTLLISFVTSIATGIVTVSLMDQAPPVVAQTVNRVIERTVQQVAPQGQPAAAVAPVTQEKTVVVKESDLLSQAVSRAEPSLVRIYSSDAQNPQFLGLGVVLDSSGTIITDANILPDKADAVADVGSSSHVRVFVTSRDSALGIAYLRSATSTEEGGTPTWTPVSLSTTHTVLGQTVVSLTGKTVARIENGVITSVVPGTNAAPDVIDTSVNASEILPGSPLISTNGTLIGISTSVSRAKSPSGFVDASALMKPSSSKGTSNSTTGAASGSSGS